LRSLGELRQLRGEYERASATSREPSLILELEDYSCAVTSLNAFANLDVARDELDRAVRLFAAAESIRETIGSVLAPALREQRDRGIATARAQLAGADFQRIWAEGRALSMAQPSPGRSKVPARTRVGSRRGDWMLILVEGVPGTGRRRGRWLLNQPRRLRQDRRWHG